MALWIGCPRVPFQVSLAFVLRGMGRVGGFHLMILPTYNIIHFNSAGKYESMVAGYFQD